MNRKKQGFCTEDVAFSALGLPVLGSATTSYKTSSNSPKFAREAQAIRSFAKDVSRFQCFFMFFWGSIWQVHICSNVLLPFCCSKQRFSFWFPEDVQLRSTRLLALVPAGGITMPKAEQDPGLGAHEFTMTATHRESAAVLGVGFWE